MIEITQKEAEKFEHKIIEDINGGQYALIDGHLFIINPRRTEFQKGLEYNDDKANHI